DSARPVDETGAACTVPEDCYPNVADRTAVAGDIQCLDRVEGGYCTHECEADEDCCAAEGECLEGVQHVCGPFESTGLNLCFVSCEDEDIAGAPDAGAGFDDQAYCQREAGSAFVCRSTGGGG